MALVRKPDGRWYIRVCYRGSQHWRSPWKMLGLRKRARKPTAAEVAEAEARLWVELGKPRKMRAPDADRLIGAFLAERRDNISERHCAKLRAQLKAARSHIGPDIADWTHQKITAFMAGLAGRSKHTRIAYRQSVGRFLAWCVRQGHIAENPIDKVDKPKAEDKLPEAFDEAEMQRWLAAARDHGPPWLERAVRIAIGSGLRLGEIVDATWEDVDLETGTILVHAGKTKNSRDRVALLTPIAVDALAPTAERSGPLVPELARSDNRALQRALKAAKIEYNDRRVWKRFRQWYAGRLLMAGADTLSVMQALGHLDFRTTQRHYARIPSAHVRELVGRLKI